jgi:hypothetical protein
MEHDKRAIYFFQQKCLKAVKLQNLRHDQNLHYEV